MNKAQLIEAVAEDLGTTKVQTKQFLDKFLENIVKAVSEGEQVKLTMFGSFVRRKRKPRIARNPSTGDKMQVEARTVAVFRPGTVFRAKVGGEQTPNS